MPRSKKNCWVEFDVIWGATIRRRHRKPRSVFAEQPLVCERLVPRAVHRGAGLLGSEVATGDLSRTGVEHRHRVVIPGSGGKGEEVVTPRLVGLGLVGHRTRPRRSAAVVIDGHEVLGSKHPKRRRR